MIGRFQPWHTGHQALYEAGLKKYGNVVIGVRTMPKSDKNPFPVEEVKQRILDRNPNAEIIILPNVITVFHGRDVGWNVEYIDLPPEIQEISATKIRKQMGL